MCDLLAFKAGVRPTLTASRPKFMKMNVCVWFLPEVNILLQNVMEKYTTKMFYTLCLATI